MEAPNGNDITDHYQEVVHRFTSDAGFREHLAKKRSNISMLHIIAADLGDLDMVKLTLEEGARNEATDNRGLTALHLACLKGHVEIAETLLERGTNISAKSKDESRP